MAVPARGCFLCAGRVLTSDPQAAQAAAHRDYELPACRKLDTTACWWTFDWLFSPEWCVLRSEWCLCCAHSRLTAQRRADYVRLLRSMGREPRNSAAAPGPVCRRPVVVKRWVGCQPPPDRPRGGRRARQPGRIQVFQGESRLPGNS